MVNFFLVNFNRTDESTLTGRFLWSVSDVLELVAGKYGDSEGSREVIVTAVALVPQVERLLEIALLNWQRHLTHEGIFQHVVVVDLRDAAREKFTA